MAHFFAEVIDDGFGMASDDLKRVGERYVTSKLSSLGDWQAGRVQTYGYHGEALANLVDRQAHLLHCFFCIIVCRLGQFALLCLQ